MDNKTSVASPNTAVPKTTGIRHWLPRFSLRTLLVLVMLVGSATTLWWHWEPWWREKKLDLHSRLISTAVISEDGKRLLTEDTRCAILWNLASGVPERVVGLRSEDCRVCFGRSSEQVLVYSFSQVQLINCVGSNFSSDTKYFPESKDVYVNIAYNVATEHLTGVSKNKIIDSDGTWYPMRYDGSSAFTRDGGLLAAYADSNIILYDTSRKTISCRLDGNESHSVLSDLLRNASLCGIRYAPDGSHLITLHANGCALFWTSQGRLLFQQECDVNLEPVFSLDGSEVCFGDLVRGESGNPPQSFDLCFRRCDNGSVSQHMTLYGIDDYGNPHPFGIAFNEQRVFSALHGGMDVIDRANGKKLAHVCSTDIEVTLTPFSVFSGPPLIVPPLITKDGNTYVEINNRIAAVWHRRRPEYWWGLAWLPEFWLTVMFACAFVWSVGRGRQGR